ncbi:hypothetical protein Tco_0991264 [Tanacetum coccineum]|uniref:Uncharacterized protein n=1 Tax=Tanacetum coccineum TaxID=301880 RepID=A0ABQ5EZ25_9ASTR
MAWLPMCGELRSSSNSIHWEPMFILYCRRSMGKDYRLASEINRVVGEVNNVVVEKDQFLKELDSLGVRLIPTKMAEFLKEIQIKDMETVVKLQVLEREMELNAHKKICSFRSLRVSFHIEDVGVAAYIVSCACIRLSQAANLECWLDTESIVFEMENAWDVIAGFFICTC